MEIFSLKNSEYKKAYRAKKSSNDFYMATYNESKSGKKTYLTAEEMKLPSGNNRLYSRILEVNGGFSRYNQTDVYFFNVDDRMTVECRFQTNDSKYTKRHYYKLKFTPYVNQLNDTHSIVERRSGGKFPTYDVYLRHNAEKEIVSDCQGIFKAYSDISQIKPLIEIGGN